MWSDRAAGDADRCVLIERRFSACFGADGVQLVARLDEPLYLPAAAGRAARLGYVAGHPRSALHEIAHWCIAGPRRRAREDFGYWYAPDGRDATAQRAFEAAEVLPQALEMLFCGALGLDFEVSLDNLADDRAADGRARFRHVVEARAARCLHLCRPRRALLFLDALRDTPGWSCAALQSARA